MTRWWWVRHGPTHANSLIGWTDLPADLSDAGALERLNAYLPDKAVVVSSDLIRASATADVLSKGRERLEDVPDLRELNFGTWEGKTAAQVARSDPEISREYWSNPGETAPPGGESWTATATRVAAFVDRIGDKFVDHDIIAVAHFGVILTQLQIAGAMAGKSALAFKIDNLSVTCLEHNPPHWRVLGVNHCP